MQYVNETVVELNAHAPSRLGDNGSTQPFSPLLKGELYLCTAALGLSPSRKRAEPIGNLLLLELKLEPGAKKVMKWSAVSTWSRWLSPY